MGCGASKKKSPPPDLSAVQGGQTSGICGVTKERSGYVLKQKMFSWSGDDFQVKDHTDAVAYVVKGKAMSLRDRMVISTPDGEKKALLQKKLAAIRSTFQLYTYSPNFEGQESTEKDADDAPVYRFAFIENQLSSIVGKQVFKLYATSNEDDATVGLWENHVQFALRYKARIKKYGEDEVVATAGETTFWQWEGASTIGIEMAAGLDSLALLAFCIACEKIKEEEQAGGA